MLLESEATRSIVGRSCDDTLVELSAFPNEEAPAAFTMPLKEVRDKQVRGEREVREHTPTCSLHIFLMVKPLRSLNRNPGLRYIQSFRLETVTMRYEQ
jgi:hypothetical protein